MKFPIAEKFKAPQGEGLYAGTPMAFIRLVGCSVGQKICTACDTDFTKCHEGLGGGMFTVEELSEWVGNYEHVCLTGGEPLDRDVRPIIKEFSRRNVQVHVETSGTVRPRWFTAPGYLQDETVENPYRTYSTNMLWICVSPKPGYKEDMIAIADEVKVILGGLGDGPGWPSVEDAVAWSANGKLVYIQPRNRILDINHAALEEALIVTEQHPNLRLSVQLHKFLRTR